MLGRPLYSISQIRALEQAAMVEGISGNEMMERAGKAVLDCLFKRFPRAQSIAVFCGGGNNGGDGYVLARLAREKGISVSVRFTHDPSQLKNEAWQAFEAGQSLITDIRPFDSRESIMADVFIDALLGIGVKGKVDGMVAEAIHYLNQVTSPVMAVDLPSGLNADTGEILGVAVQAQVTISFVGLKAGFFTLNGKDYVGEVECDSLALPIALFNAVSPYAALISAEDFSSLLPARKNNSHKGDYGHVLVLGGDRGMLGAPKITALGALRTGCGLLSVAAHFDQANCLALTQPEMMTSAIRSVKDFLPALQRATVLVLGPGLGQSAWSKSLFKKAVQSRLPMVIDADGLNWLARFPKKSNHWILTPHPAEAARLLKTTTGQVQHNRFEAARKIQKKYGGVIILKGAGTLIADETEIFSVCESGNPGMASGGMGDLLSGIIGGLLAQKLPLSIAAQYAVCLHAKAGDLAAKRLGERGLLATDLLPFIQRLVN